MKKYNIHIIPFCIFVLLGMININAQRDYQCVASEHHASKMKTDPDYAKRYSETEANVYKRAVNYYKNPHKVVGHTYTIPVVVHIVHHPDDAIGSGSNVTDQKVIDAIQYLNDSYMDVNNVGVDTEIEFCLASYDPSGNATNGITRFASAQYTELCSDTEDTAMKTARRWDQTSYMNIWVVDKIYYIDDDDNDGLCNDGSAGYAYYSSSHGNVVDGIVVSDYYLDKSTLPHEVGHYLNVQHTFEGGCYNNDCLANGDKVCDTPPDNSTSYIECNETHDSCTSDVNPNDPNNPFTVNQNDMTDNFMDYNTKVCRVRFTEGQKVRMHDALKNDRASLLTSTGCCIPDADLIGELNIDFEYEVSDFITTIQKVESNVQIEYDAGNYICLNPGFNSGNTGAVVTAVIDGCGGAYRTAGSNSNPETVKSEQKNVSYKTGLNAKGLESVTNYPNPFQNTTMISFNLDKASTISLRVYDASGREVSRLIDNEQRAAGNNEILFDGSDLTSGIYFYTLQTNETSITKKMLLHK